MFRLILIAGILLTFVVESAIIVGVAGGSGSGKTTLARKIVEAFGDDVAIIEQDAYYRDLTYLPIEERDFVNFDHPDALEFTLLREQLLQLKAGKCIQKPMYDFKLHVRKASTVEVKPKRVIVVEGILLLAVPETRELFDLKVYIDNYEDVRLLRRMERDIKERGRDFEGVRDQYLATVKPMHACYVEPSKWLADIIIPSNGENEVGLDIITSWLEDKIQNSGD